MAQEYLPFIWTRQDPYAAGLGWDGNSRSFLNAASILEPGPRQTLVIEIEETFHWSRLLLRIRKGSWVLQNIARISIATFSMVTGCALKGI